MCGTLLTRNAMKRTCSLVAPASNIEIRQSSTKLDAPLKICIALACNSQDPGWKVIVSAVAAAPAPTRFILRKAYELVSPPRSPGAETGSARMIPGCTTGGSRSSPSFVDDRALLPDSVKLKARAGQA